MTCMDYFIGLEGTITIGFSQEMRVWRLVEPDKELILVDSSDFAQTVFERTFSDWLDK